MNIQKEEATQLLVNLKELLHSNKHEDINEIITTIDEAINTLQNPKTQGIEISIQLFRVVKMLTNSLGFNGLKLNSETSKAWESLKLYTDKTKQNERTGLSMINSIWGSNSY